MSYYWLKLGFCDNYAHDTTIFAALGLPGWMGLDRSAAVAIVLALVLLTSALGTAYKLYHCRRNRDLRNDEMRTVHTGQYHGKFETWFALDFAAQLKSKLSDRWDNIETLLRHY